MHSCIDGHLGSLCFLAVGNSCCHLCMSFLGGPVFSLLVGVPQGVEMLSPMDSPGLTVGKLPDCSRNHCANLHSHQPCARVSISPHHRRHLLLSVSWIVATLGGEKRYLLGVLICASLTAHMYHLDGHIPDILKAFSLSRKVEEYFPQLCFFNYHL